MYRSISSMVPNAADLLALSVEELADVLLTHLKNAGSPTFQNGLVSQQNFFNSFDRTNSFPPLNPEYGDRQREVSRALTEAWSWLERQGFLVREPTQPAGWFFISKSAETKLNDGVAAYRNSNLLHKGEIHSRIATRVYPAFLRGSYDTAIFEAFREVEVAVREVGRFGSSDYGVDLMREAFRPSEKKGKATTPGVLTDISLPVAEQEAMANLFAGAIGLYKNPQSHRHIATSAEDAAEVIAFASQLLRIVTRGGGR
jgi:uncharacterized protein (TIGR02391 family)